MNKNVLIAIIVIVILGAGAYWFFQKGLPAETNQVSNTQPTDQNTSAPAEGVTFTGTPKQGKAPLEVSFKGEIQVPMNESGRAIVFFGDGVSDVMFRKGPELYEETWTHVYKNPGTYEALLVKTTESNVDADINVMKDPLNSKNTIVSRVTVVVQ